MPHRKVYAKVLQEHAEKILSGELKVNHINVSTNRDNDGPVTWKLEIAGDIQGGSETMASSSASDQHHER